jgi:hypothetical protein
MILRHQFLGLALPAGLPVWVAVVAFCVLYGALVSPLHQARHALYGAGAWMALWGIVLWLGLVAFGVWFAAQHWSEVQALLLQLSQAVQGLVRQQPTVGV